MMKINSMFFAAILLLPGLATAASFDCSKARSASEKLICSNADLSRQDDQLAILFAQAKSAANDKKAFRDEQRVAWNWRQKNCSSHACLAAWYQDRTAALRYVIKTGIELGFTAPVFNEAKADATMQKHPKPKNIHYVSPTELLAAYRGNSIAANNKYTLQTFPMSGRVVRVGIDVDKQPFIGLFSNYPGAFAKVIPSDGEMTTLAKLKPYDVIRMTCVGGGVDDDMNIALVYCKDIVLVPEKSGTQSLMPTQQHYQMLGAMP